MPKLHLTTDAIHSRGNIDPRYTCDLDNSSPEFKWELNWDEAENPVSQSFAGFALMIDDPDALGGVFTHWVIYQIPPQIRHLPAGIPPQEALPNGIRQGLNSFGKLGYAGPCPPLRDRPHQYRFRLYAIRHFPEIPHRATRVQILQAIEPEILAVTEIWGSYQRQSQKAAG